MIKIESVLNTILHRPHGEPFKLRNGITLNGHYSETCVVVEMMRQDRLPTAQELQDFMELLADWLDKRPLALLATESSNTEWFKRHVYVPFDYIAEADRRRSER